MPIALCRPIEYATQRRRASRQHTSDLLARPETPPQTQGIGRSAPSPPHYLPQELDGPLEDWLSWLFSVWPGRSYHDIFSQGSSNDTPQYGQDSPTPKNGNPLRLATPIDL